jgi:hypothetical protein
VCYHAFPVRERQESATEREGFKVATRLVRRTRGATSGLEVDVNVLQHSNVPPLLAHVLAGTFDWVGGGQSPPCLAIGVAEAATPLTAARHATKDTMGL